MSSRVRNRCVLSGVSAAVAVLLAACPAPSPNSNPGLTTPSSSTSTRPISAAPEAASIPVLQVCDDILKSLMMTWPGTKGGEPRINGESRPSKFNADLKLAYCLFDVSDPTFAGHPHEDNNKRQFVAEYRIDTAESSISNYPQDRRMFVDAEGFKVLVGFGQQDWTVANELFLEVKLDAWRGTLRLPTRSEWVAGQATTIDELRQAADALVTVTKRSIAAIN